MTVEDRDRLKVVREVVKGHIRESQAAGALKLSVRWVRKLVARVRRQGDRGVLHRLRGRWSNRKIPEAVQRKAVGILRGEAWRGYGPTLAAEELAAEHGLVVGKETLRKWMIEAKLWKPRRAKVEKVHTWRPRRERWGELVQWDTSEHDWLEGRAEKFYLIAMIDDASSRALARFVRHTIPPKRTWGCWGPTWSGLGVRWSSTRTKPACSTPRPRGAHHRDAPEQQPTQIGRALEELGIGWIAAHSPQAKGRIERFFGTPQDRLVKGLRKAGARTLEEANRYLEQVYLPMWNRRFAMPPAHSQDAHRPLLKSQALASILSRVEERVVSNDYTLRWDGQLYQIRREQVRPGLRGNRVQVEQRLDGTRAVRFRGQHLELLPCEAVTAQRAVAGKRRPPRSRNGTDPNTQQQTRRPWMEGFWRQPSPPLWQAIRDSNAHA